MYNKKLYDILKIAKTNVPFYSQLEGINETDLSTFPIIDREMILDNPYGFINEKYTMFDIKQMLCFRTSGTSAGHPLEIYWKQDDYIRSSYCIWKLRSEWYDIHINDKYVCFHTYLYTWNKASEDEQLYLTSKNHLSLNVSNLTEAKIGIFCSVIEKYKPTWIQFIPSIALKFVDYMKKHNIKAFQSVKYIEYNGETLMDSTRQYVDNFFGVKSANLYGSMEVNAIAYECPHHNMVIVEKNVLVDDRCGKILVTSLQNTVFPLIRYDLGDQVEMQSAECHCGGNMVISKIYGRTTSSIQIGETTLTEAFAAYCMDIINGKLCNVIQQYQFFRSNDCWKLKIYVLPKFKGWYNEIIHQTMTTLEYYKIFMNIEHLEITYQPIFNSKKKSTIFDFGL